MRLWPVATTVALLSAGWAGMVVPLSKAIAAESGLRSAPPVSELSALRRRARPRIWVVPQPPAWTTPRPGHYSYPGPDAVRRCADWYVVEYRPSGAVITPQMRCRWVRG